MNDFVTNVKDWPFLDEPLYRWAIFFGAMLGIAYAWNGVLRVMKEV